LPPPLSPAALSLCDCARYGATPVVAIILDDDHAQVPCRALLTPLSPASLSHSSLHSPLTPRIILDDDDDHAQHMRIAAEEVKARGAKVTTPPLCSPYLAPI
jgi:hypothetical protein